jgi:hypothetical protein
MWLRTRLPKDHLSEEALEAVKLALGFVATIAALILGLLVASVQNSFDAEESGVTQMAAKIVFLDQLLKNYGPEADGARQKLRDAVDRVVALMWPKIDGERPELDPSASGAVGVYDAIVNLPNGDAEQSAIRSQALSTTTDLGQLRWLEFEQDDATISRPLLGILAFWLIILFVGFGLFAPTNSTVLVAMFLSALSASGAIFLILELDRPFDGIIQISGAPLTNARAHLGE